MIRILFLPFYGSELLQIFFRTAVPCTGSGMQRFPAVSAVPGRWVFQEREEKQGLFIHLFFQQIHYLHQDHIGSVPLEKQNDLEIAGLEI